MGKIPHAHRHDKERECAIPSRPQRSLVRTAEGGHAHEATAPRAEEGTARHRCPLRGQSQRKIEPRRSLGRPKAHGRQGRARRLFFFPPITHQGSRPDGTSLGRGAIRRRRILRSQDRLLFFFLFASAGRATMAPGARSRPRRADARLFLSRTSRRTCAISLLCFFIFFLAYEKKNKTRQRGRTERKGSRRSDRRETGAADDLHFVTLSRGIK